MTGSNCVEGLSLKDVGCGPRVQEGGCERTIVEIWHCCFQGYYDTGVTTVMRGFMGLVRFSWTSSEKAEIVLQFVS